MLKTNYSACFSQATVDILASFLEQEAVAGEIKESGQCTNLKDVIVIVGLTGKVEGRLVLELEQTTALGICEAMNFGEPFAEVDEMAKSTLGELANLISGRAVTLLNEGGDIFSITPPMILCGVGLKASDVLVPVVIPIETEYGVIQINLAVRRADE